MTGPTRPAGGSPVDIEPWSAARVVSAADPAGRPPALDYYVILAGGRPPGAVEGIVVEEFVRNDDWSTSGLRTAGWTAADGHWWSSAAFSRGMRTDPELRERVTPVDRRVADAVHRRLGARHLPTGPVLRTHFRDHEVFATAAPLRLGPADPPAGCHERRVYRVLFAKDLPDDRLAGLAARWGRVAGDAGAQGMPAGRLRRGADRFSWQLRRVGRTIAWCLDLTVLLATADDGTVGPVLRELTSAVREHGLIPVTTERFA
ncbi:hypothetical protein ACVCAH_15825 [Micromonospora sp. LZ34]